MGKAAPTEVDKTSYKGLFSWFKVIRPKGDGGRFDQVARDLGTDPAAKLADFATAMTAATAAGKVRSLVITPSSFATAMTASTAAGKARSLVITPSSFATAMTASTAAGKVDTALTPNRRPNLTPNRHSHPTLTLTLPLPLTPTPKVDTALLPGWNVLVYESPTELAAELAGFVDRRFGRGSDFVP